MYTELAVPRTHTFGSTYIHNTLRHGSLYNGTPYLSVYTSSPFVLVNINASTILSALCDISYILACTNDGVLAVSLFLLPALF
jgi:hypothetical protein